MRGNRHGNETDVCVHFCTAVGGLQFPNELRKLQTRIIFERSYSFFHYCLLSCYSVMFQRLIPSKLKWEAQAFVREGKAPPVATALSL